MRAFLKIISPKWAALATVLVLGLVTLTIVANFIISQERRKIQVRESLQKIGHAFRQYAESNNRFPPAQVYDKEGTPLYSWRVLILPFLGHKDLYGRFHLDESWDSPHNIKLLRYMPEAYRFPTSKESQEEFVTFYQVFDGYYHAFDLAEIEDLRDADRKAQWNGMPLRDCYQGTMFDSDPAVGLREFLPPGGKRPVYEGGRKIRFFGSPMWVVAEAATPVPWTKPGNLMYHPKQSLPPLGGHFGNGFHVLGGRFSGLFPRCEDELQRVEFVSIEPGNEDRIRAHIAPRYENREGDW